MWGKKEFLNTKWCSTGPMTRQSVLSVQTNLLYTPMSLSLGKFTFGVVQLNSSCKSSKRTVNTSRWYIQKLFSMPTPLLDDLSLRKSVSLIATNLRGTWVLAKLASVMVEGVQTELFTMWGSGDRVGWLGSLLQYGLAFLPLSPLLELGISPAGQRSI